MTQLHEITKQSQEYHEVNNTLRLDIKNKNEEIKVL